MPNKASRQCLVMGDECMHIKQKWSNLEMFSQEVKTGGWRAMMRHNQGGGTTTWRTPVPTAERFQNTRT